MRPLTLYRTLVYYLAMPPFALGVFLLSLLCLVASWAYPPARAERVCRDLIRGSLRLLLGGLSGVGLLRIRYRGFPAPPEPASGAVWVANHPGLLDIAYLLARVPGALCIFKPALRRHVFFGAPARGAGYLAGDGGINLLRGASERVRAGEALIIFPEGTRTPPGVDVLPLKPGFAHIARRADAPIQLVGITGEAHLLAKNQPWWRCPRLPAQVEVTLGPRLPPADADDPAERLAEVERWLRAHVAGAEPAGEPLTRVSATS